MFELGKIYAGTVDGRKFRFQAVEKTPGENVFFKDLDDLFWYINGPTYPIVLAGTIKGNEAIIMDHKGFGVRLYA